MKTILDAFEKTVNQFPNKIAFIDTTGSITFQELKESSQRIADSLLEKNITHQNIGILTNRGFQTILGMMGTAYSSNTYIVLDKEAPFARIQKILQTSNIQYIIMDSLKEEELSSYYEAFPEISMLPIVDLMKHEIVPSRLQTTRELMISEDPVYILFTSGSTGVPKGTVITHRNLLAYVDWVSTEFQFNETTIFGSQTPFYFSMSVTDVFSTLFCGCSLYIIPKMYFSFPIKLVEVMNQYKINTIYWVPSAYGIVSKLNLFAFAKFKYLTTGLFAGEVMPTKILNYWIHNYPNVLFANLFGPTETTDICTFYKVNREFLDTDPLPIGVPCKNLDVFLVNEKGMLAKENESGELYVRGAFVSPGYYNNLEKTKEAFVQNPLNTSYPEIVYKTGDICKYNSYHELMYLSRSDFQIKHMGYRIELGEIESNLYSIDSLETGICLYDAKKDAIVLVYTGKVEETQLNALIKEKLPYYMVPSIYYKENSIRYNQNGKIDRNYYKQKYIEN